MTAWSYVTLKHERNSPEVNVLYAMLKETDNGHFFFMENTVAGNLPIKVRKLPSITTVFIY